MPEGWWYVYLPFDREWYFVSNSDVECHKKRANMIGMYQTVRPENVVQEMYLLMNWYNNQKVDISTLAEFHIRYESIHPFQDGNGRTGRLILFRECLKNGIVPAVIEDANRNEYLEALKEY